MVEFDEGGTHDLSRFLDHYPVNGDLTLQVLKGHLIIEEILRDIFTMQLHQPNAIIGSKGTTFDCHQIICLVESMTPVSQAVPWIWISAKKLNNIRNDLSHQLSPKGLKDKVSYLIKFVKNNSPEIEEEKREEKLSEENDLFFVIIAMCACLSSLKAALVPYAPNKA